MHFQKWESEGDKDSVGVFFACKKGANANCEKKRLCYYKRNRLSGREERVKIERKKKRVSDFQFKHDLTWLFSSVSSLKPTQAALLCRATVTLPAASVLVALNLYVYRIGCTPPYMFFVLFTYMYTKKKPQYNMIYLIRKDFTTVSVCIYVSLFYSSFFFSKKNGYADAVRVYTSNFGSIFSMYI